LPIASIPTVDRFNQNRATFNATISANGGTISAVTFRYGTSSNFSGALTASAVGTTDAYYNATSLAVGTVHYVRVEVTNEAGTTTSSSTSFTTWGIVETVFTQTSGTRTIPTITPRGGSRLNPSILELALFGGGGASGTYGAAGGGGGYQSSASIEVVEGSGIVTWTIGAANGGSSTIAGLSGGTLTAAGGVAGSDLQPDGYSSADGSAGDPGYAMSAPPSYTDTAPYLSGASGNGNAAGGGYFWVYDKSSSYAYGGGGGAGGAGSSYTGDKFTVTGGAGGAAVTVHTVTGGSGGGGGSDTNVYPGALTQSAYGGGAGFYNTGVFSSATAGVVRFKYYGV
jgi:hypothetical protein